MTNYDEYIIDQNADVIMSDIDRGITRCSVCGDIIRRGMFCDGMIFCKPCAGKDWSEGSAKNFND